MNLAFFDWLISQFPRNLHISPLITDLFVSSQQLFRLSILFFCLPLLLQLSNSLHTRVFRHFVFNTFHIFFCSAAIYLWKCSSWKITSYVTPVEVNHIVISPFPFIYFLIIKTKIELRRLYTVWGLYYYILYSTLYTIYRIIAAWLQL